jgi:hypothetical protein
MGQEQWRGRNQSGAGVLDECRKFWNRNDTERVVFSVADGSVR